MRRDETLRTGVAVPGALLSVIAAGVAAGAGLLLGAPLWWVVVLAAAGLLGGIVRMAGGPWAACAILIIMLIIAEPDAWRTAIVIFTVHLLQVLGSLTFAIPLRAHVTLRALRPTAARFAVVQLIAQAGGAFASLLPGGRSIPGAVIVAALTALAIAYAGRRMLRTQRTRALPPEQPPGVR
ncbi:hypothetical protein [Microbacterium suwonense]|uniref:Major facilitator superfamily (MFS) profile domain-containing protein n=1 Tax=Microbacterium suwonense TaxID=683047 RepID=A0ABN6WZT6_9MICO|nr:hypothetical protein [Microbacterium suwonense]BDZ37940.1 hypothetical protein GCM10025863_05540 [Microbacterium suwonense]